MKLLVALPVACLLTACISLEAQQVNTKADFSAVDSLAATIKYNSSLAQLSKDLTSPYTEEILKVRSIFKWITENIAYDYKTYNKGVEEKRPACENPNGFQARIEVWEQNYLDKVISKKKAICAGYAMLFKKLCDQAGIQSEVIEGYARNKPYQVGNGMSVNHAWNAVLINGNWYYLDATWAAGYCTEDEVETKLVAFVKKYQDYYWCTDYQQLKRNHFPQNGRWAIQDNFTKENFFDQPHYYSADLLKNIELLSPGQGVLQVKKGDTIHFKFRYQQSLNNIQANSNVFKNPAFWYRQQISRRRSVLVRDTSADRKQVYIPFTRKEDLFTFDYVVTNSSLYYLDILFDYQKALRFRIKIIE